MSHTELKDKIEKARMDLISATSQEEINYFGIELMVLEDKMDRMVASGRR